MGMFDWVELGILGGGVGKGKASGETPEWMENFESLFPGSFGVTVGDALASFIVGGRQTHIYGDEFKFVFDWEALIASVMGKAFGGEFMTGVGGALVFGLGGNASMVFGNDTGLKYGESTGIKRAATTDITGSNFITKYLSPEHETEGISSSFEATAHGQTAAEQQKLDKIAGVLGAILSAVMVLAALTVELLVKMETVKEKKEKWSDSTIEFGPAGLTGLVRAADWSVTSRLAAMIVALEKVGSESRHAVSSLAQAKNDLTQSITDSKSAAEQTAALALAQTKAELENQDNLLQQEITDAGKRIDNGVLATTQAAERAEQAISQIAALTGTVNAAKDDSGNITHQSIAGWSCTALDDITLTAAANIQFTAGESDDLEESTGLIGLQASQAVTITCGPNATIGMNYWEEEAESSIAIKAKGNGTVGIVGGSIETGSRGYFTPGGLELKFGDGLTGPRIVLTETSLQLAIGPPEVGASITLTEESIKLMIAEVVHTITPMGITEDVAECTRELTAEGHNFEAAETELNVGVTGITSSCPINLAEAEASNTSSTALYTEESEATKLQSATMTTLEE